MSDKPTPEQIAEARRVGITLGKALASATLTTDRRGWDAPLKPLGRKTQAPLLSAGEVVYGCTTSGCPRLTYGQPSRCESCQERMAPLRVKAAAYLRGLQTRRP